MFNNPTIRSMLDLAGAGSGDIFFDLGCGWGQNLKIALTEFNVKKAVGIEMNRKRCLRARRRIRSLQLPKARWEIINGKYETLLDGTLDEPRIEDATIVFFGILSESKDIADLKKRLKKGCRLVWYYWALIPEIMPNDKHYPFYVSRPPFKRPTSEYAWLRSVTFLRDSTLYRRNEPDSKEIWEEIRHDHKLDSDLDFIRLYRDRLAAIQN